MFSNNPSLKRALAGVSFAAAMTVAASSSLAATAGNISSGAGGNDGVSSVHGANTWAGWFDATLYLIGGPADIQVSYLGHEASFINDFNFGSISASTTGGAGWQAGTGNLGTLTNVASGALDFSFTSPIFGGTTVFNNVVGSNTNDPNKPNFFISFDVSGASGGQVAYLWLDDVGAGDDDNHDDMVIRLAITQGSFTTNPNDPAPGTTPIPGAAFLFLSGLGGFGLLRMRAKRAANKATATA